MHTENNQFTEEEKRVIIESATKENGDFDYRVFLQLVATAWQKKVTYVPHQIIYLQQEDCGSKKSAT